MVQRKKVKKNKNDSLVDLIVPVVLGVALGGSAYLALQPQQVELPLLPANFVFHLPPPENGPHVGAYLAGVIARGNGDTDKAADYYAEALKADPDNKKLLAQTYAVERGSGRFDRMLSLAKKMKEAGLAQSESAYVQFAGLVEKGDFAAALDLLQTKPGVFAPDPALRIWCLIAMGDTPKALREWNALNVHLDKTDSVLLQKALIADYLGETAEAEKAYLSLVKVKAPTVNALSHARAFFRKQGTWSTEHPLYATYIKTLQGTKGLAGTLEVMTPPVVDTPQKGIAEVFHGLVLDAVVAGNLNTSVLAGLITTYLNPESPFAHVCMAQVYETLNKYALANKEYDALPPFDAFVLRKAMNLTVLGKADEALAVLEPMKDRFVGDDTVQIFLATVYLQEKKYQEAIHHYNLFLTLTTPKTDEWVSALFARGVAYHETGDVAAAERDIAAAAEHAPENPVVLNYIGYLWLTQDKRIDESVALIEKAVTLEPDDPNFLDSLAWGYYKQERFPEALLLAERATDMLPQSAIVNEHLGDIYAAVGRNRESQYQYQKALALKDDLKPEDKARLKSKVKK